jgi:UDP-N-acetyl-D-glucosamine dehydrogenase
VWARFIELAGEINTAMPRYVVEKTADALNEAGKSVRGSRVLVLGLSYKSNIDDDRESPTFEILELLKERGAEVAYCDPFVPVARRTRKHNIGLTSEPLSARSLAAFDAVVVSTAHDQFKDPMLYRDAKIVVDTRNIVPASALPNGRLYKA